MQAGKKTISISAGPPDIPSWQRVIYAAPIPCSFWYPAYCHCTATDNDRTSHIRDMDPARDRS